jgi:hypothetical protein
MAAAEALTLRRALVDRPHDDVTEADAGALRGVPALDQAARTALRKRSSSIDSCCDCCLSEPAAVIS